VKERAERVALESPHGQPLPVIPDATQSFEIWSWSPDGRLLAGQKHLADLSHAGIGVHELGSQEIMALSQSSLGSVGLSPDERAVYFTFMAAEADIWMMTAK
jgi:hypothetical protein